MSVCEEVTPRGTWGCACWASAGVEHGLRHEGASPTGLEVLDVAKTREGDFSRLITGIVEQP
ncbi:MAG: hypothetical protein ACLTMP_07170 [Eggerthella lenta]